MKANEPVLKVDRKCKKCANKKEFQFSDTQTKAMAIFIAELTRQGVTYEVRQMMGGWAIELTGGF